MNSCVVMKRFRFCLETPDGVNRLGLGININVDLRSFQLNLASTEWIALRVDGNQLE